MKALLFLLAYFSGTSTFDINNFLSYGSGFLNNQAYQLNLTEIMRRSASPAVSSSDNAAVEMGDQFRRSGNRPNNNRKLKMPVVNPECCAKGVCACPYPVPMPVYPLQAQAPVVVPLTAVFEPVIHDHPPLRKIHSIMKRRRKTFSSDSSDFDDTETDTSSSEDTSIEYYGDFLHVRG